MENHNIRTEASLKDHGLIKENLLKLEKMELENPQFQEVLAKLMDDLTRHVKKQEAEDFPLFEKIGQDELNKLGNEYQNFKKVFPKALETKKEAPFDSINGLLNTSPEKILEMKQKFENAQAPSF